MNKTLLCLVSLLVSTLLVVTANAATANATIVHHERSLYRNIIVEDTGDLRCLKFNVKRQKSFQSCMLLSDPQRLVFNYTKLLFSSLLLTNEPESILIIGLGGGTMSNTLHQLYPQASITNVEIDPAVIKVARKYFGFFENERVSSVVQDGRIFIKRAGLKKQKYDWIILDAFNGDYIPEHLLTQEFLQEAKDLLSDDGVLAANTFSISQLYNYESATYKSVFGDFYNVRKNKESNRIIVASQQPLPDMRFVTERAQALAARLLPFDINISDIASKMTSTATAQDWPVTTELLTDQYSPANLLNISDND